MHNRSLTIFESAIKSPASRKIYMYSLNEFMGFIKIKDYDDVPKLDSETIQTHLENWVLHLRDKGLKSHTIRGKLSAVELFLEMNKVLYYKKIVRKLIPSSDYIPGGEKPFTTEDIQKFLKHTNKPRTKALVLFFASTGARPASIVDPVLRLKHLEDMPNGCKAVRVYEGSREAYWAFLTPEAGKALDHYLSSRRLNGEKLNPESPVFANFDRANQMNKNIHMSEQSAKQIMQKLIRASGIERTKQGKRYDKASVYGFRKRFNTILKLDRNINSNITEKLMAHKNGLDGAYLKPTRDECFNEFVKAILELTIFDTERDKVRIENLEQETTEFSQLRDEISSLKEQVHEHYKLAVGLGNYLKNGSTDIVGEYSTQTLEHFGFWEGLGRIQKLEKNHN